MSRSTWSGRVGAGLTLALLLVGQSWAGEPPIASKTRAPAPANRAFHVGLWLPAFVDFNLNDARVAAQIWVEKWGKKSGLYDRADTEVFETSSKLQQQITQGSWDVIMFPVEEYFRVAEPLGFTPDFTISRGDLAGDEYVLLVRRDSGIRTLDDLEGRKLVVGSEHNQLTPTSWLRQVLEDRGLPDLAELAESTAGESRPTKVVLSVFFGQADAALVSRHEFDAMVELNPQVGQRLVALAASPRLLTLVFSLGAGLSEESRATLRDSLSEVHLDEEFRQLLLLQKVKRLVPIDAAALEASRRLYERNRALRRFKRSGPTGESKP